MLKREIVELLRGVISSGYEGTQNDLCNYLSKQGYQLTQSTVSRALKKIGAVRVHSKTGSRYELQIKNSGPPGFRGAMKELVTLVCSNESQIVIRTRPGSAMFVAGFIDHYCDDILGTIAGDDTIFVAPKSVKNIRACENNVRKYLDLGS